MAVALDPVSSMALAAAARVRWQKRKRLKKRRRQKLERLLRRRQRRERLEMLRSHAAQCSNALEDNAAFLLESHFLSEALLGNHKRGSQASNLMPLKLSRVEQPACSSHLPCAE